MVLDASPLVPVADALPLAAVADKILFMVKGAARREQASPRHSKLLCLLAGIALNKVDYKRLASYGYGFGEDYT